MALLSLQAALVAERSQVLESLGICSNIGPSVFEPISRKRPRRENGGPSAAPVLPQRRSARVAELPSLLERAASESVVTAEDIGSATPTGPLRFPACIAPPAAAGSVRSLISRIAYMTSKYLGEEVPVHFGGDGNQAKRAVMYEANAERHIPRPTFSIMSGMQEWANAVFLFVVRICGVHMVGVLVGIYEVFCR